MSTLGFWTAIAVFYQTVFSIIVSWLILSCKLPPNETELHEVTLLKLLYIHDPQACGRVYFYNYTKTHPVPTSNIVWPVKNEVAASFRRKISAWLTLHILWAFLGFIYMSQGTRHCGFYATLLPFSLTGFAILIMDLIFTILFIMEATKTDTEENILQYINFGSDSIRSVNKTLHQTLQSVSLIPITDTDEDTTWIALLLAYISCRAVLQWFMNFWIVKDNYYEGLAYYQRYSERLWVVCIQRLLATLTRSSVHWMEGLPTIRLAYISCRAVVQWFMNFWIGKDNYYEELAYYQRYSERLWVVCIQRLLATLTRSSVHWMEGLPTIRLAYISCRAVVQWFMNFRIMKDNYYEGLAYYCLITKKHNSRLRAP